MEVEVIRYEVEEGDAGEEVGALFFFGGGGFFTLRIDEREREARRGQGWR